MRLFLRDIIAFFKRVVWKKGLINFTLVEAVDKVLGICSFLKGICIEIGSMTILNHI